MWEREKSFICPYQNNLFLAEERRENNKTKALISIDHEIIATSPTLEKLKLLSHDYRILIVCVTWNDYLVTIIRCRYLGYHLLLRMHLCEKLWGRQLASTWGGCILFIQFTRLKMKAWGVAHFKIKLQNPATFACYFPKIHCL